MKEYKFKIGDKVRVISLNSSKELGTEFEIKHKDLSIRNKYPIYAEKDNCDWVLEEDLELVVDKKKNQDFKVGQRVRVISGANTETAKVHGKEGIIKKIDTHYSSQPCIYVDFGKIATQVIWVYPDTNNPFNVEIIEETTTKTNNMNSKQFKNNFGIYSDSAALIEAFIQEVQKFGWKESQPASISNNTLYFAGDNAFGTTNKGTYWRNCQIKKEVSNNYNLPAQWDEAIKAASETIPNTEEYKVGDYVILEKAGGWGYSPDNNGCVGLVNKVDTQNSWNIPTVPIQSIYGTILNPRNEDTKFNGIPCFDKNARNPYSQPLVRKATKEEIEEATKLKVGDWVMCLEGYSNSYGTKYAGAGYISGKLLQIHSVNDNTSSVYSDRGNYTYFFNNHSSGVYSNYVRKATKEEIEKHSSVTIAGYIAEREGSLIAFGCQKFSNQQLASYRELLTRDAFSAELTIKDTKITVEILDKLLAMLK